MPSMARNCLVVNLDRCIGCYSCELACKMENGVALGHHWNKLYQVEPYGEFPNVKTWWLSKQCQQCTDAPCINVCPTGASYRDEEDGVVGEWRYEDLVVTVNKEDKYVTTEGSLDF